MLREALGEAADNLDIFDRPQLARVIAECRGAPGLAAAGRSLFTSSRTRKKSSNDSDRLRKYLDRFGLDWQKVSRIN